MVLVSEVREHYQTILGKFVFMDDPFKGYHDSDKDQSYLVFMYMLQKQFTK